MPGRLRGPVHMFRLRPACFTVSNLYYIQAILNRIADTFAVTSEEASSVATLICHLGDVFPRRPFILALVAWTATLVISRALVGDLAPPARRASLLALIVSGLSLGVLVARLLSGSLASDFGSGDDTYRNGWRRVYWFGLGAQWFVAGLLYVWLPDYPSKNPAGLHVSNGDEKHEHDDNADSASGAGWSYLAMLASIGRLVVTEPLLVQARAVAFLLSAVFTSYWTTLSFLCTEAGEGQPVVQI
ncbi:hypothetical protein N658DRAFT_488760 [Parathielavia hyrcaniae]|uniref:Uncharacterized protein n=1 Tax=Parathielavia hyrcaniae TaxID=113614 RepID=A0AAN6SYZ1_9PEZI|nr:hypothetical protein N658DRAFT_488760 [Parathielavia hyrcaniae]